MHRCVHGGRRVCVWCFMQSLAFPIEHVMWERLPLLRSVTAWLGV